MTEKKKEFFGYVRASTNDQQLTLADQESKINAYCNYKGYKIIEIYIDSGVSGSINAKDRPEMRKLLDRLQKGEGDGMIVTKPDRLSRSSSDFINIMNNFNNNKIKLIILDPELDTNTPHGAMILTIMSALAQMELQMIRQRTKDALKKKKDLNQVYGQIPYGKSKTDDNKLIDNKDEQNNINLIVKYYLNEKMPIKKICEKLIEDKVLRKEEYITKIKGIETKIDKNYLWFPTQIMRILKEQKAYKETKQKRDKF